VRPELLVNPGVGHTSPQGRYRPRNPVNLAFKKREHRPTRAHVRAFASVVSRTAIVTPQEYDATAIQFVGWRYSQTCDRCGGTCHSFDCSGLQCHCLDILGIGIGCLTSFVMSSLCYDNGLLLPLDVARGTQSHWAVKGSNLGRGAEPGTRDGGHIVDGRGIVNGRAETMEAMGRAWGCLIADWDNRGWNAAYKIPGVLYVPPEPPFKVKPMFDPALDTVRDVLPHPQGKGSWIALDSAIVVWRPTSGPPIFGGMTSPADRTAWGNRHVASLQPYTRKNGDAGYRIFATDGGKVGYVPEQEV